MTIGTCLAVRVERGTYEVFLHDTSVPKQSSSLTHNENDVVHVHVSDFISKAEKEAQRVSVTLCTQSKRNI